MKKFISCVMLSLMVACSGQPIVDNVGDGKFDQKEQAYFQLAVGAAMSIRPEATAAVFIVTSAMLKVINADIAGTNDALIAVMNDEVNSLDLDPYTGAALIDLLELVKANIFSVLDGELIPASDRLTVVKQMLEIINRSAEARI